MKLNHPFPHIECEFKIRQSKRARKLSLKVNASQQVTLVIPQGHDANEAIAFAKKNEAWVEKQLSTFKQKAAKKEIITSTSGFKTRNHDFIFTPHKEEKAFVRILSNKTNLAYPHHWDEKGEAFQGLIQLALKETYRSEAKQLLPRRLITLANKYNFNVNKISVRDSKTRWGSCSSAKNISLSIWLMKLPDHLIDYILLHELCHTKEMNHGPKFYKLLNSVTDNRSEILRKEVNSFSIK